MQEYIRELVCSYKRVRVETDEPIAKRISNSADAAQVMGFLRDTDRERFAVIHLNAKNKVLSYEIISVGTLTGSLVHPREVFKGAILANAAALVLVHNHPSGDPTPSAEDIAVTTRLFQAGNVLGIEILDHVVIGDSGHRSLAGLGLIPRTSDN
ncbi:MAG: DNA repair protein RadC [Planctomycetota bacterium]